MEHDDLIWENGRIERTTLGVEDHGMTTAWLHLSFDGSGQGFGGLCLDGGEALRNWVRGVLAVVGVDDWELVKGRLVRVGREKPFGLIVAIKPIVGDRPIFRPGRGLDREEMLIR